MKLIPKSSKFTTDKKYALWKWDCVHTGSKSLCSSSPSAKLITETCRTTADFAFFSPYSTLFVSKLYIYFFIRVRATPI